MSYTDFSWHGDAEDRKLTIIYVLMLGGAPVAWSSRKEPMVALSSCEAQHIEIMLYACQATWMINLVEEITRKNHGAMTMNINNMLVSHPNFDPE